MKQKSSYDAVIIGSGLGGLTCAAYLAKKKKKVLVLESHNLVGGCATVYTRKGVKFEVGLHEMDMPRKSRNMKHCIFKKLGVYDKINLVRLPHVWRIKSEATDITVPDGYQNIIKVLGDEFPEEKAGLKKYFAGLSRMLYMIRRLPYDLKFFDFFFYSITTLPLNIYHYFTQKNVGSVLDSIIKSDKLKRILNINISYYHDNPYEFSWYYHACAQGAYYQSSTFVKGGSQELSNANAAPQMVYNELLPKEFEDTSLRRLKNSASLYTVYLIFKKKPKEVYPGNAYSTFITTEKTLNAPFRETAEGLRQTPVEERNFVFVDYSVIDSGLTEENDERGFGVLTGTSYLDEWESLSDEEYKARKEALARHLFDRMEEHYPGFKDLIEYYEVSTPKTIKRYIRTPEGTAYGYVQNRYMRHSRVGRTSPTVKNLHFASAWGAPGGGFTGAIIGGYFTARNMLFPATAYVILKTLLCTLFGTTVGTAHLWVPALIRWVKMFF